ncbi:MAG: SagB/ThcOx family dehydrogenase [Chloroflexi bacterium]|nr:SagB/ThcOx family dehydrogenase [Chloroflexota bacterium]
MGRAYHRWSRITPHGVPWGRRQWGPRPPQYKLYTDVPVFPLPTPPQIPMSVSLALERRRSIRDYTGYPISPDALSALLHAAQGITEPSYPKRAAPSAGALYPLELYAILHRVRDVEPGLYHYRVTEHALEQLRLGDLRKPITRICLDQEHAHTAAVVFVITGVFARTEWKYEGRAYRYVLQEVGHVGENIYLAATGLGLGACAIGAYFDEELDALLGVDGEEETSLYVLTVGQPAI